MARYTTTRDRVPERPDRRSGRKRRLAGALLGFLLAGTVTAGGAIALVTAIAYNSPGQAVTSGKISLALADNGAGFTTAVSGLLPTDTVNRFVDVTNSGTADATNLTLTVTAATSNKLVNDATNGLQIAIASCTGGTWTPGTNSCSGTVTPLVATTPLSGMTSTPQSVIPGTFAQGAVARLRVTLSLPNQSETTTNGVLPANSIQALTNTLTYTFTDTQRAGVTTSS